MPPQPAKFFGIVILLFLCLSACTGSLPTHYFILTSLPTTVPTSPLVAVVAKHVVAITPVEIPLYLSRSQIVARRNGNYLEMSQFELWGDNLRENISRVLLENLSTLLGTERIFLLPSLGRERPTLQIFTTVSQFEPSTDDKIVLKARWQVTNGLTGDILAVRQSHFVSMPVPPKDYNAIVAEMSALLLQLSQEMAHQIGVLVATL